MAKSPRKARRTAIGALALLISAIGSLLAPSHADAVTPPQARFWVSNGAIVVHVDNLPRRPIECQLWIPDPLPWGFDTNRIVKQRTVTTGSVTLSAIPQLHPLPHRYYTFVNCFAYGPGKSQYSFVRKAILFVTPFGGFGS
ncbi:hypothetical protein [Gordonia sp. (in: high G+C Gram-positive bacteria)]|jgi:hypothetical protein|uniref:hypothetical protein n=1 Tax=Gordonia sp. (in: high G+C Gram-positive bacteria) TaxID=84139 RepID=UPI002621E679|nr:hypothetical protein [Gordonia sp. (in: high G+C Gram-positive bacteria)]HMS76926.1 hypothetical protein [Gordonia sp. (in: high G+C Gram-positive bacteria)]HQV19281.1 hypothetical protein [Gordonia sp. (in: high G+C Gram-positive bacteria)]